MKSKLARLLLVGLLPHGVLYAGGGDKSADGEGREIRIAVSPGETQLIEHRLQIDRPLVIRDVHGTADRPAEITFGPEAWIDAGAAVTKMVVLDNCSHVFVSGLKLDGKGKAVSGLAMHDVQHVTVQDFHIRNLVRMGIDVYAEKSDDDAKMNRHLPIRRGLVENVESSGESSMGIRICSWAGHDGTPMDRHFRHIEVDGVTIRNVKHWKDSDGIKVFPGNTPDADRRSFVVDVVIRNCSFFRTAKRALKLRGQNITLENLTIENDVGDASARGGPMIDLQSVKNLKARNIVIKATNYNDGIGGHRYIEDVMIENVRLECIGTDGGRGRAIGYIGARVYKNVLFRNITISGEWKDGIYFNDEPGEFSNVVFDNVSTGGRIQLRNASHRIRFVNSALNTRLLEIHPVVRLENMRAL